MLTTILDEKIRKIRPHRKMYKCGLLIASADAVGLGAAEVEPESDRKLALKRLDS